MTRIPEPAADDGFTLVEMLVALTIFALLAGAGVGLLRSSVDTQGAVERRLADMSAVARLQALLANDLSNALARPARLQSAFEPSFVGSSSSVTFLRSGFAGVDGLLALQQVEWRLEGDAVHRSAAALGKTPEIPARLTAQVQQLGFRYRMANGAWSGSFQGSVEEPVPQAVEMTIVQQGRPPLTAIVALPPSGIDGAPVPAQPVPAGGSA